MDSKETWGTEKKLLNNQVRTKKASVDSQTRPRKPVKSTTNCLRILPIP